MFRSGVDKALVGVRVPAEEASYFAALVLRQLSRRVPGTPGELVTAALRAYVAVARNACSGA